MEDRKQVIARIPKELHRKAKIKAAQTGRSITEVLKEMLEEWVRDEKRESQ